MLQWLTAICRFGSHLTPFVQSSFHYIQSSFTARPCTHSFFLRGTCLACRACIPFVFIALHSFTLLAFSFRFASTPFSSIRLHFFHQMFVTQSSFITLIAYTAGIAASSPFILSPFHSLTLLVSFHYNSIHRFESFIP